MQSNDLPQLSLSAQSCLLIQPTALRHTPKTPSIRADRESRGKKRHAFCKGGETRIIFLLVMRDMDIIMALREWKRFSGIKELNLHELLIRLCSTTYKLGYE